MGDRVTVQVPESKRRSTHPREQAAAVHFRVALYLAHGFFRGPYRRRVTRGNCDLELCAARARVLESNVAHERPTPVRRQPPGVVLVSALARQGGKVRLEHKGTGGYSTTHRSRLAVAVTNHFFLGRAQ